MKQGPVTLILLPVMLFALFFGPDMVNYGRWYLKADQLCDFAVEQMSINGGWNQQVETEVEREAARLGIQPGKWVARHTEGRVSFPEKLSYGIDSRYHVRAFDVFGTKMKEAMGNVVYLPISISKNRVSEINVR